MRELTAQQREFVLEFVRTGGRGAEAARKAGYSERSAGKYAFQLLELEHVQAAIHKEQNRSFAELASISLAQAKMMLEDAKTPAGARAQLIMTMLDRAGHSAKRDSGDPAGDVKPLREMSLAELEDMLRDVKDRAAQ
jgi:phage terminase small subunit